MKKTLLIAMVCVALFGARAMAADYVWTGDGADNKYSTDDNWLGDVSPGDGNKDAVLLINNQANTFEINFDKGVWEYGHGEFESTLGSSFTTTGNGRVDDPWEQNSAQTIDFNADFGATSNVVGWTGTGTGTVNFGGGISRLGANTCNATFDNANFQVNWSGGLGDSGDNDNFGIIKNNAGTLVASGTYWVDSNTQVNAGTFTMDGLLKDADIVQTGGTFNGIGTIELAIDDTSSELVSITGGTFDGSGLTLAIEEVNLGATQSEYVLVDYAGASSFTNFGTISGTPAGYSVEDTGTQIKLVPEPATMLVLGLGGIGVLLRRRRS